MRKDTALKLLGVAAIAGGCVTLNTVWWEKKLRVWQNRAEDFTDNYLLASHWLQAKNNGGSAAEYFLEQGYRQIGIYGMGQLANRLIEDLRDSEVEVLYGIDRDACCCVTGIAEVYSSSDPLPSADAVVVTVFSEFESIEKLLREKVDCPILSIETVIWSV